MSIEHYPVLNIREVAKHYRKKDGVPVKYVCTTSLPTTGEYAADVFYRETPHPEFGNRYFGLVLKDDNVYITNAEAVENLEFGCVENDIGSLEYSSTRHDYKRFQNENMIDGGRDYVRSSGFVHYFRVKNGEFIPSSSLREVY